MLLVYYTYTQQSRKVAEAMADVLSERGCEVRHATIGFTDKRWAERFSHFPLRHVYRDLLGLLPAQLRGATGEIQIPAEAREGDYDLICVGSPTWFFMPCLPIRFFLPFIKCTPIRLQPAQVEIIRLQVVSRSTLETFLLFWRQLHFQRGHDLLPDLILQGKDLL